MQILAGDIGGTKTTLAFVEASANRAIEVLCRSSYASPDHASLDDILDKFLQRHAVRPDAAAFGVAGPVRDGRCVTTNLPWVIDTGSLGKRLGTDRVWLINDLEANAWGIQILENKDFFTLNPGSPHASGNRCIISAGTGLGEAGLFWNGKHHIPFASEGGHAAFSPTNEREIALLNFLRRQHDHVGWEQVLSGSGLVNIHQFLLQQAARPIPDWLREETNNGDPAAAISAAARQDPNGICATALRMFTRLYGVEAGNHALKIMATGGVYLGGGIAPKILEELREPEFLEGFFHKGRMETLMRDMPVKVILEPDTALLGAALYARQRS